MKKFLNYLPFLVLSLFFFMPAKADAKSVPIVFDKNDRYNYFYEQKFNTPFYNFLVSQGENIYNYFGSIVDKEFSSKSNPIFIYYVDELVDDLYTGFSFPNNTKYVIQLYYSRLSSSTDDFYLYRNGNSYSFSSKGISVTGYYFAFDSNGNYLGYLQSGVNGGSSPKEDCFYSKVFHSIFFNIDANKHNADFSYFISKYYLGSKLSLKSNYEDVIVSDLVFDSDDESQHFILDDNSNYSSFKAFLRRYYANLTTMWRNDELSNYDVVDTNLSYFKDNKVWGKNKNMLSFYNMVAFKDINSYVSYFDSNYSFFVANTKDNSYFLIPKSTSKDLDYNVYYYSGNSSINLNILTYDISTDNYKLLEPSISFNPKTNEYFRVDFSLYSDVENFSLGSNFMYYIYANIDKYPIYIYYNHNAYDLVHYNSSDFSFKNVNTDNSLSFKKVDLSTAIISAEKNNSSVDVDFSVGSAISGVTSFFKEFSGLVLALISYVSLFFESLPLEVRSCLIASLIIGTLVLIIKIIRG